MRGFLDRLGESLRRLMQGRNGSDALSIAALIGAFVIVLVNSLVPSIVLSLIGYALLGYSIFRVFSRNTSARAAENERFLAIMGRAKRTDAGSRGAKASKGTTPGNASADGRLRLRCEGCGQSLSVPKGRGTLKVTCPKCHHQTRIES